MTGLVALCADVDEILPFRRKAWARPSGWPDFLRFVWSLRRRRWDAVLDFQGLIRSGFLSGCASSPRKLGFAHAREGAAFFYDERLTVPPTVRHAVAKNILLANALLGADEPCPLALFRENAAATAEAAALLAEHPGPADTPLLAVAPASRWPSKTWPPEFFAAVILGLHERLGGKLRCWLSGTADETAIGHAIRAALPPEVPLLDLMGRSQLPVMVALLQASNAALTNDSGPMHIAAALGVSTAALFGPTDPELTGPWGPGHRVFVSKVDCAPCFQRNCPLPRQLCRDDVINPDLVADHLAARLRSP